MGGRERDGVGWSGMEWDASLNNTDTIHMSFLTPFEQPGATPRDALISSRVPVDGHGPSTRVGSRASTASILEVQAQTAYRTVWL